MEKADVVTFLRTRVELFREFPAERLDELLGKSRLQSFEASEAAVEFGEEGRFLGVLLSGRAAVSVVDDNGQRVTLRELGPGDLFGEMSLMTGDRTTADVIGLTRYEALLIPHEIFSTSIATYLPAIQVLARTISERMRRLAETRPPADAREVQDPYGLGLTNGARMKLLVINCGSSSLKYRLIDTSRPDGGMRGTVERIGDEPMLHRIESAQGARRVELPRGSHREAFAAMMTALTDREFGAIGAASEIGAVGHRVVHGGETFTHSTLLDDAAIARIDALSPLAPLHNPVNLTGIREARALLPDVPHVAVFDTAFHHSLPAYAYLYGLPHELCERHGIRRYGFHGTSHLYVSLKAAEFLKRPFNALEIVSCHLGNGASVCAVDHGRSVDTSMGLTPAEGLIMGTRSGDVDPGALIHLMRTEGLDADGMDRLVNRASGLKGLSGVSNDLREIEAAAEAGDCRALLAIKAFSYRIRKYIGAYAAAMGGIDVVVFTGGIGQGSSGVRSLACQGLGWMGIEVDDAVNRSADGFGRVTDISTSASKVRVLVVPTDEERMIARETVRALGRDTIDRILRAQSDRPVPIEISAHHVHLSPEHVEALFGEGHTLTPQSELSQPGQFACTETVNLVGPKGRVERVRVLGPPRKETQVEIAMSEQFKLGVAAPIRESGDLENTPGLTLEGSAGNVRVERGVICALRHIHMPPEDALRLGLGDRYVVRVRVDGDRELVFGDVLVRVSPNYRLAMHLDTDEGNAANLKTGMRGVIEAIQSRG